MIRWGSVCCCLIILLTSCASAVISPVTSGFRCHATIEYEEFCVEATLDRSAQGQTVLLVHEPAELSGLSMSCNGEQVTIAFAGMELALGEEAVPTSVIRALDGVFEHCTTAVSSASRNTPTVTGETDCGPFTLTLDEKSGMPASLEIPSLKLRAVFSEWQVP